MATFGYIQLSTKDNCNRSIEALSGSTAMIALWASSAATSPYSRITVKPSSIVGATSASSTYVRITLSAASNSYYCSVIYVTGESMMNWYNFSSGATAQRKRVTGTSKTSPVLITTVQSYYKHNVTVYMRTTSGGTPAYDINGLMAKKICAYNSNYSNMPTTSYSCKTYGMANNIDVSYGVEEDFKPFVNSVYTMSTFPYATFTLPSTAYSGQTVYLIMPNGFLNSAATKASYTFKQTGFSISVNATLLYDNFTYFDIYHRYKPSEKIRPAYFVSTNPSVTYMPYSSKNIIPFRTNMKEKRITSTGTTINAYCPWIMNGPSATCNFSPYIHSKEPPFLVNLNNGAWKDSYSLFPMDQIMTSETSGFTANKSYAMYESTNHTGNTSSAMYISFSGSVFPNSFTIWVKSYGEYSYDYLVVNKLDNTTVSSAVTTASTSTYAHTSSVQYGGSSETSVSYWKKIKFNSYTTGDVHTITVQYRKDSSDNDYLDRGFVIIPLNQCEL